MLVTVSFFDHLPENKKRFKKFSFFSSFLEMIVQYLFDVNKSTCFFFLTKRFKKSYTGIELRYVYRNWEELKDKVVFIKQKKQVEAPWKQEPKLWDAYIPKSHQQKKECMLQKENDSKRLCSQVFFNEKIGNVKKKISHNLRKKSKNLENQKMINSLSMEGLKASEKEMITTKNDTTVKEKRRFVNLVKFTRNDSYHVAHVAKSSEKLKKEKVSCFSLASYSRD